MCVFECCACWSRCEVRLKWIFWELESFPIVILIHECCFLHWHVLSVCEGMHVTRESKQIPLHPLESQHNLNLISDWGKAIVPVLRVGQKWTLSESSQTAFTGTPHFFGHEWWMSASLTDRQALALMPYAVWSPLARSTQCCGMTGLLFHLKLPKRSEEANSPASALSQTVVFAARLADSSVCTRRVRWPLEVVLVPCGVCVFLCSFPCVCSHLHTCTHVHTSGCFKIVCFNHQDSSFKRTDVQACSCTEQQW